MAQRDKSRFWRKCRIYFRRFRISVLLVVLTLLCCLLYLNQIGLPDFIKRSLVQKLHARGLDLEFTRMRWRWNYGIVAENVRFGRAHEPSSPKFSVKQAQVRLDYRELLKFRVQVNGLVLHEGDLSWDLSATNEPARTLSIENIQTELRLLPGDLWELDHFQAEFAGAKLQLGGVITNASVIRDWKALHKREPSAPGSLQKRLRKLADTLDRIHFATTPELALDIRGDARDLQSFTVRLNINTPDADTPWGEIQNAFLSIVMLPGSSNVISHAEINLEAQNAQTRWAGATNLNLKLHLLSNQSETNLVHADLNLSAAAIHTKWSEAANARLTAQWLHSVTNAIPVSGTGDLQVDDAQSKWANAGTIHFTTQFDASTNQIETDDSWAWWSDLAPYLLNWECEIHDLQSPKLSAKDFACAGNWRAPNLEITRISSALYDGMLNAEAALNITNRIFSFKGSSDFNVQKISPFLTDKSREWLSQFTWNQPPKLEADGLLTLPVWTNLAHADWHGEVRPSIRLNGYFDVGDGSFRGIRFSSANSHFSYSNLFWRLPDLVARRAEGQLRLSHVSNEATRDYYFHIYSTIHPIALKPLLQTNQYRIFDILGFSQPPVIDADIWGRWYDHERIGARGRIAVTNFTVRGQTFGDATATMEYTNLFLKIFEPRAHSGIEHASATSIDIDIPARKLFLTNAVGLADPNVVVNAIGPKIAKHMEPYHFTKPINAHVEGVIPMRDERDADLHFDLEGGPFEWWKFRIPHISGRVDWVGQHLALKGMKAEFYNGTATGDAEFDFHRAEGTDFRFRTAVHDADLHLLMTDLSDKTNRLEGLVSGRAEITEANSHDLQSIQGRGRVELRDGLIWQIPVIGVLSPALDSIAPGLGSSRASEASATFVITNGVARSDDLELRASVMRLQYWGTVDWKGWVNARVQAEFLRDMWGVGRMISLALWPVSKVFEYKITGTVHEPKTEPVFFIPKVVMLPFHPIRTLKELAPEAPSTSTTTNAPLFQSH